MKARINDLQEIYNDLHKNAAFEAEKKEAENMFSFKTFAEEFKPLKNWASYGRWFFGLFSIITGFTAIYGPFSETLWAWLAATLAGCVLLIVEALKSFFFKKGLLGYYQSNSAPLLLLAAFPFLFASVYLSLTGVETIYKNLDRSGMDLEKARLLEIDSLNRTYQGKIDTLNTRLERYEKSITWLGKVDISNPATKNTRTLITKQITATEWEKDKAFGELEGKYFSLKKEQTEKSRFNVVFWVVISGINELLIVACIWFLVYYYHRINLDSKIITNKSYHISLEDITNFTQFMLSGGNFSLPALNQMNPAQPTGQAEPEPSDPIQQPEPVKEEPEKTIGFKQNPRPTNEPQGTTTQPADLQPNDTENGKESLSTKIVHKEIGNRVCNHCGVTYLPKHHKQKYCSDDCRVKSWEERNNKKMRLP